MTLLDHHRIRREYTPVDSPKYDGVVERRIALVLRGRDGVLPGGSPSVRRRAFAADRPLWAEVCVHANDAINVSARVSDKPDMFSPYQKLYGRAPFPRLLPFLKPGFHHVKRALKSERKAQACFFLNSGSNHPRDCCKNVPFCFFTSEFGITFQRGSGLELVADADADYASKATDMRSVSGGAVMCAGACVCWFSRTQKCVTLSTTEAEYVALADTIKEDFLAVRVEFYFVWSRFCMHHGF